MNIDPRSLGALLGHYVFLREGVAALAAAFQGERDEKAMAVIGSVAAVLANYPDALKASESGNAALAQLWAAIEHMGADRSLEQWTEHVRSLFANAARMDDGRLH